MSCASALKIAKTMKRDFVYITPTRMIGIDAGKCALSIIDIESDIVMPFAGKVSALLNEKKKESFIIKNASTFLHEYKKIDEDLYCNIFDQDRIMYDIMDTYNRLQNHLSRSVLITSMNDLHLNSEFMDYSYGIRAGDGYKKNIIDGFYFDYFTKMHSNGKSDKVSLNIYDNDEYSYIYEFFIDKKKYIIKEYFRIRKLNHYSRV